MGVKDVAQINGLTLGEGRLLKLLVWDDICHFDMHRFSLYSNYLHGVKRSKL